TDVVFIGQNEVDMTIAIEIPGGDTRRSKAGRVQGGGEDQLRTHGRTRRRHRGSRERRGKDTLGEMTRQKPGQYENRGHSEESSYLRTMETHSLPAPPRRKA